MSAPQEDRALALHVELTEIIRQETGMYEGLASTIARHVLDGLQRRRAGGELYIPKSLGRPPTREEIRAAFDGTNRAEVCKKFGISRATFYRAISRRRSLSGP